MADIQYNIDYLCRVFRDIANNIVVKYTGFAEDDESFESRSAGDLLINATYEKDNFFMYDNYSKEDFDAVGYYDTPVIDRCLERKEFSEIPKFFHDKLLPYARKRYIENYEEENDYYRELYGLPTFNEPESEYIHVDEYIMKNYGIAVNIPIHNIRNIYNRQTPGLGDRLILTLENTDWYKELLEEYPDKGYLKHAGVNRIQIAHARRSKNFSLLAINTANIDTNFIEEFIRTYEQCRDYFVKTIYNFHYRGIIDFYDNFIGLCILLMTFQQIAVKIPETYINRNFFNVNDIRDFYELYGIPYDLSIPKQTQKNIIRNLNMLIKAKGTDKVVFDIIELLGFTDITVNKYYLVKNRKVDEMGVPIIKKKKHFNTNTGKVDEIYDYESMHDLYFYKMDVRTNDITNGFKDASNKVPYKDIVSQDPFWFDDANTYSRVWETQYNYVESKYLSLGVSYSITEMMLDNAILFKMLLEKSYNDPSLYITLPQITDSANIPIFDVVCMMIALTSSQHNLNSEIISLPSKVIALQDYCDNTEYNTHLDTLRFNYKYFLSDLKFKQAGEKLAEFMRTDDKTDNLYNEFMFNFKEVKKVKNQAEIHRVLKNIMTPTDYALFVKCIESLSSDNLDPSQKVKYINITYSDIKELHNVISYYLTDVVNDKDTYMMLKRLHDALFNSKLMTEMFTITGKLTGVKRTAYNYYEYLYHTNPLLYGAIYKVDLSDQYSKYCETNHIDAASYPFNDYLADAEKGTVYIDYKQLKDTYEDAAEKKAGIAAYVTHIITRMKMLFTNLPMTSLLRKDSNIENLLLKMLRYFKSYTIDILNFNTLFKMDYKTYNTLKLMDTLQITHIDMDIRESFNMSYSDFVKKLIAVYNVSDKKNNNIIMSDELTLKGIIDVFFPGTNYIKFKDAVTSIILDYSIRDGFTELRDMMVKEVGSLHYRGDFRLRDTCLVDMLHYISDKEKNNILLKDTIKNLEKSFVPNENGLERISLIDIVRIVRTIRQNERLKFRDEVIKVKI